MYDARRMAFQDWDVPSAMDSPVLKLGVERPSVYHNSLHLVYKALLRISDF